MSAQPDIPVHPLAQKMDYEDWEKGKHVPWIDWMWNLLDNSDEQAEGWLDYRATLEPYELAEWKIVREDIPRRSFARLHYVLNGIRPDLQRDCGYGDTTMLRHFEDGEWVTWMSDTKAEILEHAPLINKLFWIESLADTSILINGLGIGVAVRAAQKHNVDRIDVVEIDEHVIEMVSPNFRDDPRVTIHHADAYEIQWPRGTSWTFAWHDIWPSISPGNIEGMDKLIRKYKHRVQWQGCWQREGCLRMRRTQREMQKALKEGNWQRVKELDPLM